MPENEASLETVEGVCREIVQLHMALLMMRVRMGDALVPPYVLEEDGTDEAALQQLVDDAAPAISRLAEAAREVYGQAKVVESGMRGIGPGEPPPR